MRIAFLWYGLTGYLNACLKSLAALPNVEVFVAHKQAQVDAPFDEEQFGWIRNQFYWRTYDELPRLRSRIDEFRPDAIVIVGWNVKEYQAVSRAYAGKALRIMTMDNNWMNTTRQRVGALSASYRILPYADAAWVPGERQAVFARKLGFHEEDIIRGLYSCDHAAFSMKYRERTEAGKPVPHNFLFVGRFVAEKGISVLAEAYQEYRSMVANPWTLTCCGTGPLQHLLEDRPGIQVEGFVQPSELPHTFERAGCFLLPSIFEPWAVVVHEAAAAGLVILASERVGASPHLVQYNYNGYVFEAGNPKGLANHMVRISNMTPAKLDSMSSASFNLSQQFTPAQWADSLTRYVEQRRPHGN